MKHLSHIPLILLMLWTSAVSYATESDVYGCHKIESITNKTVIDTGLNAQLLDNIDDDIRTKIQFAALVAAGPEIGISLIESVSATRLLRTRHATKPYAVISANEVRLALAQKDLEDFSDAWNFVRTHLKGADAWEFITLAVNKNTGTAFARDLKTLQKVVDMISEGSAFRVKFPGNWQAKIEEALFRHKHLNCSTCNGNFNRGPNMDEFLRDFEFINLHFVETTDLGTRLHAWSKRKYLNGNDIPIDHGNLSEVHQTLNFIRKRNLKETDINKMDGVFFDDLATSKKFDLELVDGPPRFIELKNKDFVGMQNLPSSDIDQVLSSTGAFSKIDNIDDYNWVAYLRRFGENADPSDAVTVLKGMWKDAIDARKTEVFNTMRPELKANLFGQNPNNQFQIFEAMIPDLNSNLYKFIKAE